MFNLVEKTYALYAPTQGMSKFGTLNEAVNSIFNIAIMAAGIIFIVLFVVGGIQYLSSAGNEEATGKAKKLLVDAIIGLVIVLAAWAVGSWILNQLGLSPASLGN